MKRTLFYALIVLLLASCASKTGNTKDEADNTTSKAETTDNAKDGTVELLYFHGKQRCLTCMAIEKFTTEVVEKDFQEEVALGELSYRIIDIQEEEKLADKYEIASSSLILISRKGGEERVMNLTQFAFAYARKESERYCSELAKIIREEIDNSK